MKKVIYKSNNFELIQYYNGDELACQIHHHSGGVCFIDVTEDSALELIDQLSLWIKQLKGLNVIR